MLYVLSDFIAPLSNDKQLLLMQHDIIEELIETSLLSFIESLVTLTEQVVRILQ